MRECFDVLSRQAALDLWLFKGAGPDGPRDRSLPHLRRDGFGARLAGELIRRGPYVVEQATFAASLLPSLLRERPDVVYYCDPTIGKLLWHARRMSGARFRLLLHNGGPHSPPYRWCDHVQQLTPVAMGDAIAGGHDPERQTLLPCGFEFGPVPTPLGRDERLALRRRLGLPEDRPVVLSVGALNRGHKRMDYVVGEIASLAEPRPFLAMLGAVESETPALRALAELRLGRDGFALRTVNRAQMDEYYRAADVFTLASVTEAFGLGYVEALSHGLPCIVHDQPVTRFVLNGEGLLADLRRPGALAERVRTVLAEEDTSELRARRYHAVRSRFGWDGLVPRYVEMLERCAGHTNGNGTAKPSGNGNGNGNGASPGNGHRSLKDASSGEQVIQRVSAGARLLTARGFGMRMVSIASNLALLALVTPADLGLLAVVRGLTVLAGNTTDLGFGWALLRRKHAPSSAEYGALSGVQLSMVLLILGIVSLHPALLSAVGSIAPAWHGWMIATLAATLSVPFGTSAKIRIERSLDYRWIAIYDVTSVLLLNLTLLGFALAGDFATGVFVGTGGSILYGNLLLWFRSPGPRPSFRLRHWRRLAGEFAGFSAGHACYLVYSSATPLVVARCFGLPVAGIWSFATRVGNVLQVAFEGFRRAAVPAAPKLLDSTEQLARLVHQTLAGAARLTLPALAAIYAALPVAGEVWPHWAPGVRVGQLYALGFGLTGILSASLVPVAVALRGPTVVVAEQIAPLAAGWLGFLLLWLTGGDQIAWVVPPMFLALGLALWRVTDPAVRPRWTPDLTRLALALGVVVLLVTLGQALHWPPLPVAAAAAVCFAGLWYRLRGAAGVASAQPELG